MTYSYLRLGLTSPQHQQQTMMGKLRKIKVIFLASNKRNTRICKDTFLDVRTKNWKSFYISRNKLASREFFLLLWLERQGSTSTQHQQQSPNSILTNSVLIRVLKEVMKLWTPVKKFSLLRTGHLARVTLNSNNQTLEVSRNHIFGSRNHISM